MVFTHPMLRKMSSRKITISIPEEMFEFLLHNPDLSPSKMFQVKCYDIMRNREMNGDEIQRYKNQVKWFENKVQQLNLELDKWKLTGEKK